MVIPHLNTFTRIDDHLTFVINLSSIFKETDQDGDKSLSAAELKAFLQEIKFRKLYSDKDKATLDMMKEFDMDSDKKININEFVKGMEKWIEETKNESSRAYGLDEVPNAVRFRFLDILLQISINLRIRKNRFSARGWRRKGKNAKL